MEILGVGHGDTGSGAWGHRVGHGDTRSWAWGHRDWGMGTQRVGHGDTYLRSLPRCQNVDVHYDVSTYI